MIVSLSATCDEREMRLAVHEVRPDEHHGRAGSRRQQDQPGDVAVDLIGGQQGRNRWSMNSQPSSAIEKGLTSQLTPTVAAMPRQCASHLSERSQVDLQQHGNDHQPDQHRDRQVDLRDGRRAERMEHARHRRARARCRRRCRARPIASGSARMFPSRGLCPVQRRRHRSWRKNVQPGRARPPDGSTARSEMPVSSEGSPGRAVRVCIAPLLSLRPAARSLSRQLRFRGTARALWRFRRAAGLRRRAD